MRPRGDDSGFTLVELLVAVVLLGILGTVATGLLLSAARSAEGSKAEHEAVEEARLGLNRVGRELRQATAITYVQNEDGPARSATGVTVVSFEADFNGDGCINGVDVYNVPPAPLRPCLPNNASDPERLSYCHQPPLAGQVGRLYVLPSVVTGAMTSCTSGAEPILAGRVDRFELTYLSNEYRFDLAPSDGQTSWSELDAAPAPFGNGNGNLDGPELRSVDSIVVDMTLDPGDGRDYRTQVALRNLT